MTSWEYMKKRRKWTAIRILRGLEDKSWETFQLFFAEHGVQSPEKDEYDAAIKQLSKQEPVAKKPAVKKSVAKKKSAVTKSRKKPAAKK